MGSNQLNGQLWYADDGLIACQLTSIPLVVATLEMALLQLGLRLNHSKCEMLTGAESPLSLCPSQWILRTNPVEWEYLGVPLCKTGTCLSSIFTKAKESVEAIANFGRHYPQQGLTLLRQTAGCCRVEHVCKVLPPSALREWLFQYSNQMRDSLSSIPQRPVTTESWQQAVL